MPAKTMTPKRSRLLSLEAATVAYLLVWIPYIALTKGLSSIPQPGLGRPMTGLEILPISIILIWAFTYAFLFLSGWWRSAHYIKLGGLRIPHPIFWTLLSGLGSGLLLTTVPLSFTFVGVSIPFMQLLMRGDVLVIAPLVDLANRRKVRWWSVAALVLVFIGMAVAIWGRGGLNIPPMAILAIVLYGVGYLVRLNSMTKVAKSGDPNSLKRYYVEEQLVGTPIAILGLGLIVLLSHGPQAAQLRFGFTQAWATPSFPYLIGIAGLSFVQSVLAARILLDPHENSYCVPLERSASVLGGLIAAYLLAVGWGLPYPTGPELAGALFLIGAILILSLGPRLGKRAAPAPAIPPIASEEGA